MFLFNIFSCAKKVRRTKAGYKFETPQQVSTETKFQNGLFKQSPECSSERRLGNFNRFERRSITYSASCSSQKVSSLLHSRESVPIHMSLFRSLPCAKKFHKDSDCHSSLPQNAEPEISCLSGRLVSSKPDQTVTYRGQNQNNQSLLQTRSLDQSIEIGSSTQSEHNLHRSIFPFRKGLSVFNSRENSKNTPSNSAPKTGTNSSKFSTSFRPYGFMHRDSASCFVIMRPVQFHLLHYWRPISQDLQTKIPINSFLVDHLKWWKRKEKKIYHGGSHWSLWNAQKYRQQMLQRQVSEAI